MPNQEITLVMFPDLIEATNDYWRKLNELEAAYRRGEVSLEEVDLRVKELVAELGRQRRESLSLFWANLQRFWQEQREMTLGIALITLLTYAWVVSR